MELWRRIDSAWAKWEGRLTVLVLLSMVFVAGFSAAVRNLTRFDIKWANDMLMEMEWADSFLRKGTMWLAFLGASLATHYRKHISIDLLTRIAPLKQKYAMHAAAGVFGGLITIGLAYSFSQAVALNLQERPIEYEILGDDGSMHVCDATDEQLAQIEDFERPGAFCSARTVLRAIGIKAETPGAAFQLIVPIMFILMGLRFIAHGTEAAVAMTKGTEAMQAADAEEHARLAAVQSSTSIRPDAPGDGGHGGAS